MSIDLLLGYRVRICDSIDSVVRPGFAQGGASERIHPFVNGGLALCQPLFHVFGGEEISLVSELFRCGLDTLLVQDRLRIAPIPEGESGRDFTTKDGQFPG